MVDYCVFCGFKLGQAIKDDGITSCENCGRIFDSSRENRILSAAWMCRKQHQQYAICLKERYDLSDADVELLQKYVIDQSFSHDEFYAFLRKT